MCQFMSEILFIVAVPLPFFVSSVMQKTATLKMTVTHLEEHPDSAWPLFIYYTDNIHISNIYFGRCALVNLGLAISYEHK